MERGVVAVVVSGVGRVSCVYFGQCWRVQAAIEHGRDGRDVDVACSVRSLAP